MQIVHGDYLYPRALDEAFSINDQYVYVNRLVIFDHRIQVCGDQYPIKRESTYKTLSFKALNPRRICVILGSDIGNVKNVDKAFFVDTSFKYAKSGGTFVIKEKGTFALKKAYDCTQASLIVGRLLGSCSLTAFNGKQDSSRGYVA